MTVTGLKTATGICRILNAKKRSCSDAQLINKCLSRQTFTHLWSFEVTMDTILLQIYIYVYAQPVAMMIDRGHSVYVLLLDPEDDLLSLL